MSLTQTCHEKSNHESCSISKRPFRIAIGSCNNQNLTQPLWDILIPRKPVAFVWAGDAIYAGKSTVNKNTHKVNENFFPYRHWSCLV